MNKQIKIIISACTLVVIIASIMLLLYNQEKVIKVTVINTYDKEILAFVWIHHVDDGKGMSIKPNESDIFCFRFYDMNKLINAEILVYDRELYHNDWGNPNMNLAGNRYKLDDVCNLLAIIYYSEEKDGVDVLIMKMPEQICR